MGGAWLVRQILRFHSVRRSVVAGGSLSQNGSDPALLGLLRMGVRDAMIPMKVRLTLFWMIVAATSTFALIRATAVNGEERVFLMIVGIGGYLCMVVFALALARSKKS